MLKRHVRCVVAKTTEDLDNLTWTNISVSTKHLMMKTITEGYPALEANFENSWVLELMIKTVFRDMRCNRKKLKYYNPGLSLESITGGRADGTEL